MTTSRFSSTRRPSASGARGRGHRRRRAKGRLEGRGRVVRLADVEPSDAARELAGPDGDPRHVEVILRESSDVIRSRPPLVIAETRHGFVCASAGVDASNTPGDDMLVLLPIDPDASASSADAPSRAGRRGRGRDRERLVRARVASGNDRRRARGRRHRSAPRPAGNEDARGTSFARRRSPSRTSLPPPSS